MIGGEIHLTARIALARFWAVNCKLNLLLAEALLLNGAAVGF